MQVFKKFKTDAQAEISGVWRSIGEGAELRVARLGNPVANEAYRIAMIAYKERLESKDPKIASEANEQVLIDTMKAGILLDFRGLTGEDGQPLVSSPEMIGELLSMRDFRFMVHELSQEMDAYLVSTLAEQAKNLTDRLTWDLEWGPQIEFFVRMEQAGEETPLRTRPQLIAEVAAPYEAYQVLSVARDYGESGPQAIKVSEIRAYFQDQRYDAMRMMDLIKLVQAMDITFLNKERAKLKAEFDKIKKKGGK